MGVDAAKPTERKSIEAEQAAALALEPKPTELRPTIVPPRTLELAPPEPAPVRRSPDPVPLSPGRYKLQVTLDDNAHQTLSM